MPRTKKTWMIEVERAQLKCEGQGDTTFCGNEGLIVVEVGEVAV